MDNLPEAVRVSYVQLTGEFYAHPVHSWTVTAVDWRCCDFTVIVAPDTIDFTYLLTYQNDVLKEQKHTLQHDELQNLKVLQNRL